MKTPEHAPIQAVAFVRQIRDAHAARLEGKTLEERLAFYRDEGGKAQAELERLSCRKNPARHTAP